MKTPGIAIMSRCEHFSLFFIFSFIGYIITCFLIRVYFGYTDDVFFYILIFVLINPLRMKKIFLFVLVFSIGSISAFADSDVSGHRYEDSIQHVLERGIMNGYPDGTFQPDKILNRAELLKIVIGAAYLSSDFEGYTGKSCFKDVPANSWYSSYVCFAKDKGIVSGYDGNVFKPEQDILFVEAVKIGMDVFGHYDFTPGEGTPERPWYSGPIGAADTMSFIPPDINSFDQYFSRAQMAKFAMKLLDYKEMTIDYDDLVKKVTYKTIEYGDNVDEAVWGRGLSPAIFHSINDVYQFALNSNGEKPRNIQSILYDDWYENYEIIYNTNDKGVDLSWGITTVYSHDDILKILNEGNSEDAEIVFDTWEASDGYFVMLRGENPDAKWKYKTLDGDNDLLDFVNGKGEYDTQRIGPILESDDGEITIFYRDDVEIDGEFALYSDNKWDNIYYVLNGFAGNYWDPVERAEIFDSNEYDYRVLYKKN